MYRLRPSLFTVYATLSVGCSSPETPVIPNPDAGSNQPDATVDSPVHHDALPNDSGLADIFVDSTQDATDDAPTCTDFGGTWTLRGTCSSVLVGMSPGICVTQQGCSVDIFTSGVRLQGTASFDTVTASTSDPTIQYKVTCTGTGTATRLNMLCDGDYGGFKYTCEGIAQRALPKNADHGFCCLPATQSCNENEKCSVVSFGASSAAATACVPVGSQSRGEPCSFPTEPEDYGHDTCASGLVCHWLAGDHTASARCASLCEFSSDCKTSEVCTATVGDPLLGVCSASCDPWNSNCPKGQACVVTATLDAPRYYLELGQCLPEGRATPGQPCTNQLECQSGLVCLPTSVDAGICAQACDKAHPCPTGSCTPLNGPHPDYPGWGGCSP